MGSKCSFAALRAKDRSQPEAELALRTTELFQVFLAFVANAGYSEIEPQPDTKHERVFRVEALVLEVLDVGCQREVVSHDQSIKRHERGLVFQLCGDGFRPCSGDTDQVVVETGAPDQACRCPPLCDGVNAIRPTQAPKYHQIVFEAVVAGQYNP